MVDSADSSPTTRELLQERYEEEKKRFEKLNNPIYLSASEADKRGAILLAAVFNK